MQSIKDLAALISFMIKDYDMKRKKIVDDCTHQWIELKRYPAYQCFIQVFQCAKCKEEDKVIWNEESDIRPVTLQSH